MELLIGYVPAHLPQHIETDIKHAKEIGCSGVLFALQENHIKTLTGALRFGAKIAKNNDLQPYFFIYGL